MPTQAVAKTPHVIPAKPRVDVSGNATCNALTLTEVATGLQMPMFLTSSPRDSTRLYVIESAGRIRVIKDGALLDSPFLDLSKFVTPGSEKGLLGLALHQDYFRNGRFFVSYMSLKRQMVIAEHVRSSANADVADANVAKRIFSYPSNPRAHNSGQLAFGSDGLLYLGTGGEVESADLSNKYGKILRIDVDNPAVAPLGNINTRGADSSIYVYGFHNPWRFSFDRKTGQLYISDVGGRPNIEEVTALPPKAGGSNLGYPVQSGTHCAKAGCDKSSSVPPTFEYAHDDGRCAVIGGYVYRGSKHTCLRGHYVFSDFCKPGPYSFRYANGKVDKVRALSKVITNADTMLKQVVSLGEGPSGELYFVTMDGRIMLLDSGSGSGRH